MFLSLTPWDFDQNLQLCSILLMGGGFGILACTMFRTSYFWCSNRYWFQLFAFAEAIALVNMEACTAVNNQQELNEAFEI
jgi:hypothetical protein